MRVVAGADHDAQIGAHRGGQQTHRRRRHRTQQQHVHARGRQARRQRVLEHVARQARVLADHHAVSVAAVVAEVPPRRRPDPQRHVGRHRPLVCGAADPVRAEQLTCHPACPRSSPAAGSGPVLWRRYHGPAGYGQPAPHRAALRRAIPAISCRDPAQRPVRR